MDRMSGDVDGNRSTFVLIESFDINLIFHENFAVSIGLQPPNFSQMLSTFSWSHIQTFEILNQLNPNFDTFYVY